MTQLSEDTAKTAELGRQLIAWVRSLPSADRRELISEVLAERGVPVRFQSQISERIRENRFALLGILLQACNVPTIESEAERGIRQKVAEDRYR